MHGPSDEQSSITDHDQGPSFGLFKSFRLGRIFGIPIKLDITFLLVVPVFAYLIGTQIEMIVPLLNESLGTQITTEALTAGARPWLVGLFVAIGLFVGVALHELGHSVVAMAFGYRIEAITLWLLGGIAHLTETPRNWLHEFWIAIAGPVVSIAVGIICYVVLLAVPPGSNTVAFVLAYLAVLNVALAAFNMLPAFPLDGGRVLRAILARRQSYARATRQAAAVGKAFAVLLGLGGLLMLNLFWVAIAFFIYIAAAAETRQMMLDAVVEGMQVRDIMTPASDLTAVSPNLTINDLLDQMLRERQTILPVNDENEDPVGIISLRDIHEISPPDRSQVVVADVMTPADKEVRITPDSEVVEVFQKVNGKDTDGLLVINGNGDLVGIVTLPDLMTTLQIVHEHRRIDDALSTDEMSSTPS